MDEKKKLIFGCPADSCPQPMSNPGWLGAVWISICQSLTLNSNFLTTLNLNFLFLQILLLI